MIRGPENIVSSYEGVQGKVISSVKSVPDEESLLIDFDDGTYAIFSIMKCCLDHSVIAIMSLAEDEETQEEQSSIPAATH